MKKQVKFLVLAGLLLPTLFSACTATATTTVQGPPPARVEVIPVAPSVRHIWIPGHYIRRGRNYIWVNGYYQMAPARYRAWAPGYWRQSRRGPIWVEGHWR
ncbi:YXWGXW repeat-containing protein [Spirosoma radiotolerans]|uniref:YXWGXW repeat-containing protein n=1 Tax=Spirosoma radiotolerans TaxID=1379870 RepID=UPI0011DD8707|nr:YXWGXW repeat-containing protein [Spirosoma radiotolerans]